MILRPALRGPEPQALQSVMKLAVASVAKGMKVSITVGVKS